MQDVLCLCLELAALSYAGVRLLVWLVGKYFDSR